MLNLNPEHQLKVPTVRRPAYTLYLEQANRDLTFIHCDIHGKWTSKVKKALQNDWTLLKFLHGGPLFALHDPEDHKHAKFLRLFGLRKVEQFVSRTDGRTHHIYMT